MLIVCGKCGGRFTSAAAFREHGSCIDKAVSTIKPPRQPRQPWEPKPPKEKHA